VRKCLLIPLVLLSLCKTLNAQTFSDYKIPVIANKKARMLMLQQQWLAVQQTPSQLGVRDCFLFLLDAIDTKFIEQNKVEWVLKLVQKRMISNPAAGKSYGNIFWGWNETGIDIGDGNNIEFCMQYGMLIKLLYNNRLSDNARKTLDEIFTLGLKGARNQEVRVSYTNIYLMKIWNFIAFGQVYNQPAILEEGRSYFNKWIKHVANFGNREYDSPTYAGVDMESLLLINTFCTDPDIKAKVADVLNLFMTDIISHYHPLGGFLGGAHSRDYNRVFGRDLLEEKYFNPLLGKQNNNTQLFNQICLSALEKLGLSPVQKALMNRQNRFIVQRWDSLPHTYACDYIGKKVSLSSTNQAYSPDDKPFAIYLSSKKIPAMPNIVYVMEGRDDHYGIWGAKGWGDKYISLIPPNYPINGGWGKTRHLMPFMQSAQNNGELVMLVSGQKDHNCIKEYVNSTIILPNYFNEMWMGNTQITGIGVGNKIAFDSTQTFFARFEDVAVAFKILWDNADPKDNSFLYNDGFAFNATREKFQLVHNKALRITIKHPNNGIGSIAMWWKTQEGIHSAADFAKFRNQVLQAKVSAIESNGIIDVSVMTSAGKLGVKANLNTKKRLDYYNPFPLPNDFLFNIDGLDVGKQIMQKYR
jgi:hypothetical protein